MRAGQVGVYLGESCLRRVRYPRPVGRLVGVDVERRDRVAAGDYSFDARRYADATLAAALHGVAMKALGSGYSTEVLIAGRPGSWESSTLLGFTWQIGSEVGAGRIDQEAGAVVEEVVGRWVLGDETFVEVAENLAAVLGPVVDQAGGWAQVADQWLVRHESAETIRGYIASRADTFGPSSW